jgi:hypothetical protein
VVIFSGDDDGGVGDARVGDMFELAPGAGEGVSDQPSSRTVRRSPVARSPDQDHGRRSNSVARDRTQAQVSWHGDTLPSRSLPCLCTWYREAETRRAHDAGVRLPYAPAALVAAGDDRTIRILVDLAL